MNLSVRLPFDFKRTLLAMALVCLLTGLFALGQNLGGWVGGPISSAKIFWLNYALLVFLVLPFCLWQNPSFSADARRLFGWVFAGFAVRGVIEPGILYFSRGWKCIYGITHDGLILLLIVLLGGRLVRKRDQRALAFAGLVAVSLVVEAFMAWQFSLLASPAAGIYFADNTEHFRWINTASWIAVAIGYPTLGFLLRRRL